MKCTFIYICTRTCIWISCKTFHTLIKLQMFFSKYIITKWSPVCLAFTIRKKIITYRMKTWINSRCTILLLSAINMVKICWYYVTSNLEMDYMHLHVHIFVERHQARYTETPTKTYHGSEDVQSLFAQLQSPTVSRQVSFSFLGPRHQVFFVARQIW